MYVGVNDINFFSVKHGAVAKNILRILDSMRLACVLYVPILESPLQLSRGRETIETIRRVNHFVIAGAKANVFVMDGTRLGELEYESDGLHLTTSASKVFMARIVDQILELERDGMAPRCPTHLSPTPYP